MKANKELMPEWDATASYSYGDKVVFKEEIWSAQFELACNYIPGEIADLYRPDGSYTGLFSP